MAKKDEMKNLLTEMLSDLQNQLSVKQQLAEDYESLNIDLNKAKATVAELEDKIKAIVVRYNAINADAINKRMSEIDAVLATDDKEEK